MNVIPSDQPTYRITLGIAGQTVLTNTYISSMKKALVVRSIITHNDRAEAYPTASILFADPNAEFPDAIESNTDIVIELGYGNWLYPVFSGYVEKPNLQYDRSGGFRTLLECAGYAKKLTKEFGKHSNENYSKSWAEGDDNAPSTLASRLVAVPIMGSRGFHEGNIWYNQSSMTANWKKMDYHFAQDLNFLQVLRTLSLLNKSVLYLPTKSQKHPLQDLFLLQRTVYFKPRASEYRDRVGTKIRIGRNLIDMQFRYNSIGNVITHIKLKGGIDIDHPSRTRPESENRETHVAGINEPRSRTYPVSIPYQDCLNELAAEMQYYTAQNPNSVSITCDGLPTLDPRPPVSDLLNASKPRYDIFSLVAPLPTELFPELASAGKVEPSILTKIQKFPQAKKAIALVNGIFYIDSVEHHYDASGFSTVVTGTEMYSDPSLIEYFETGLVGVGINEQRCHHLLARGKVTRKLADDPLTIEVDIGTQTDPDKVKCGLLVPFTGVNRGMIAIPKVNEAVLIVFLNASEPYIIGSVYYEGFPMPTDLVENEIRIGDVSIKIDASGNVYIGDKTGTKALAFSDHKHTVTPPTGKGWDAVPGTEPATVSASDSNTTKVQAK